MVKVQKIESLLFFSTVYLEDEQQMINLKSNKTESKLNKLKIVK